MHSKMTMALYLLYREECLDYGISSSGNTAAIVAPN
jgi:hypothetical protein